MTVTRLVRSRPRGPDFDPEELTLVDVRHCHMHGAVDQNDGARELYVTDAHRRALRVWLTDVSDAISSELSKDC